MISNTELKYVNNFARHVPYPGVDYASSVMEDLIKSFNLYNQKYLNKEYSVILSNGEEIEFGIKDKNLAHMLGIDYKGLMSDQMRGIVDSILGIPEGIPTTSYEVLKAIIDRADDVIEYDKNSKNQKLLNYYKLAIKCAIFSRLSSFEEFNFGCINFDKDTFVENTKENFSPQSTKLLFTKSNQIIVPYFMMGIKKDQYEDKYLPETLFAPEKFPNFFVRQELVLPTQILISDDSELKKIEATPSNKLALLNMYRAIINAYNTESTINIFSDYERVLIEDDAKSKILTR